MHWESLVTCPCPCKVPFVSKAEQLAKKELEKQRKLEAKQKKNDEGKKQPVEELPTEKKQKTIAKAKSKAKSKAKGKAKAEIIQEPPKEAAPKKRGVGEAALEKAVPGKAAEPIKKSKKTIADPVELEFFSDPSDHWHEVLALTDKDLKEYIKMAIDHFSPDMYTVEPGGLTGKRASEVLTRVKIEKYGKPVAPYYGVRCVFKVDGKKPSLGSIRSPMGDDGPLVTLWAVRYVAMICVACPPY